jgi:acyl carrier protein
VTDGLEERTRRVVADVLGLRPEEVSAQTSHLNVSEWDSMAMINLVMALEAEFRISLSVEDASRLVSVAAVLEVVRQAEAR